MKNGKHKAEIIKPEELYRVAIDSVKRYKEQGEELQSFDSFINEVEEEYKERQE